VQLNRESITGCLHRRGYDVSSVAIILLVVLLLFRVRAFLPVFSDSWYHLAVIRAFSERGISLHAWWEFAPFGRPHLYSPLFHVVGVAILKLTGWDLLEIARLYDVVTFPLVLAAGWWAARSFFGKRAAFLTLLLLLLNIGLVFPCSLIMMPGTYALILWPLVCIKLLGRKLIAAGLLLGGMLYLHLGVACVAVGSLFLFAMFKREFLRPAVLVAALACVLFSPWLAHLFHNRAYLQSGTARLPIFMPAFTLLAAVLGIVSAVRERGKEPLAILAMIIASVAFWFTLQERFWTYGGFLFALLGGYGIERWAGGRVRIAVGVLLISCVSVTPFLRPVDMKLAVPVPFQTTPFLIASPLLTLADWQRSEQSANLPKAVPEDLAALTEWIKQNLGSDTIILTEDRLLGASLFVLTGRRTTSGLWSEAMTGELKQKLTQYFQASSGYIIVNRNDGDGADPPGKISRVASFGEYTVLYRSP